MAVIPPAVPGSTAAETAAARLRNALVSDAKSLPALIAAAQVSDPAFAQQLSAKAAIYSKTYYATLLAPALAWLVSRYGLGLDADTQALIVFVIGTATAWLMRTITSGPISGLVSKGKTP